MINGLLLTMKEKLALGRNADLIETRNDEYGDPVFDEAGNIGVRVVNKDNLVEFYRVEIIQYTEKGVWVSGLPFNSRIITVGQDYVNNNEKVDIAIDYRINKDENIN